MKLRFMGQTGVSVSPLCLGAMNFGMPDWGVGEKESLDVINSFIEAGGNFIDTADVYGKGRSEEICGKALKGRRDRVVLATKGHFPVVDRFGDPPAHENALGSSRRHLTQALHDSLRRLGTDYIDLYQVHCWDERTPLEETLSTLDDFVRAGKVRYAGLSNYDAWQIVEARQLCIRHHWEPFVTAQMQYSLVCRDIEPAIALVCRRYGMGILAWSPLGGGVLTGKYDRDGRGPKDSRFGATPDEANAWRKQFVNPRNLSIVESVKTLAARRETSPSTVSLAWLLARPVVSSVIIGPKSAAQLRENLAACELELSAGELQALDEASAVPPTYPHQFIAKTRRNQA